MSDALAPTQPAEISAAFQDQGLREALRSDDWQVRERAQQQWSSRFRAAYGDVAPELAAPSSGRAGQQNVYSGGDVDSDVPPAPEHYSLHPTLAAEPEFSEAFKDWAFSAGFGIGDVVALGGEVARLSEAERDPPEHIRQSKSDLVLADLAATDEGQRVLHFARLGWARLEARNPGLAELLDDLGCSTDPAFIRRLAVATARRGG
jgi:hypothetical protein